MSELIEREHLERYNLKNVRRENNFNGSVIRRLISSKKKKNDGKITDFNTLLNRNIILIFF